MPVFISYSSKDKFSLKNSLVPTLKSEEVEYWTDAGIENGEQITEKLRTMIQKCEVCILLATTNSISSEWCLMEIAAFWGASKKVIIFSSDGSLSTQQLPNYLRNIKISKDVKEVVQSAKNEIDKFDVKGPIELINAMENLREKLEPSKFCDVPALSESSPMLKVALRYFETTGRNMSELKSKISHLSVPATEYPDYLIDLQSLSNIRVRAIALVDEIERFWDNDIGDRILHSSSGNKTQRVFAFKNQTDFTRLKRAIKDHCKKYDARLISTQNAPSRRENIHDFSLIWFGDENISTTDVPPGTMLAYYKTIHGNNEIEFSLDPLKVNNHWQWFMEIHKLSISPELDEDNSPNMSRAAVQIFGLEQKEMSHYIPEVAKYDKCERLHPYFGDMRKSMLLPLINWAQANPKILKLVLAQEFSQVKYSNFYGKVIAQVKSYL